MQRALIHTEGHVNNGGDDGGGGGGGVIGN